jgi:hypothetical protein
LERRKLREKKKMMKAEMKAESSLEKWYPRQGLNLRPFAPEAQQA